MLVVSTSFARVLSSCRCVGISFLCHQTSCAPTSQKSQSSPLKSLCPSHFCFNHHQRPSQRAIFARTQALCAVMSQRPGSRQGRKEARFRWRSMRFWSFIGRHLLALCCGLKRIMVPASRYHMAIMAACMAACMAIICLLKRRKTTKAIMAACISLPQCLGMQQR